ncbi:hypothetical protein ACROYT_G001960 [Oculina patagonica]
MRDVYDATRLRFCSEPPKKIDMVRNKAGYLSTKEEEVLQRWKEHFAEIVNRPSPEREAEVISDMEVIEEIPSGPITKVEIRSAITSISSTG